MSENSKCGTGCVVGVTTSEVKLPNLVSPSEVVAGKRPCAGKLPFNVAWCRRAKGWPAGSMVHTQCGYFFNTIRAYGDPADADSEWIAFDFKFLFNKLLETMQCGPTVPHLEDDVKIWDPSVVNVAQPCDTWAFTVEDLDEDGNVIGCHQVFASALESDLIKDIYDKPSAWSEPKTSAQLMCELLINPTGIRSIDDSDPTKTTLILNNGTVLTSPEQPDEDKRLTNPRNNADGSFVIWDIIDADGNVVGQEMQPTTPKMTTAEFQVLFQAALDDACFNMTDLGASCGEKIILKGIKCAGGGYKFGFTSAASSEYGKGGFNQFDTCDTPGLLFPADPNAGTLAVRQAVENQVNAGDGTINSLDAATRAQLESAKFFCFSHTAKCDEVVNIEFAGTVKLKKELEGTIGHSEVVFTRNGAFNMTSAGDLTVLNSFTDVGEPTTKEDADIPMSAGETVEFCFYLIRASADQPAAQISVRNCNGTQRPSWRLSQANL